MKQPMKTAVIGAGNMGQHHVRVYNEISHLVCIADVKDQIGRPLAAKYNVKFYKNYKEMLKKEQLDAVSVVVPTPFHKDVAIDCLQQKIPILIEKPITDSVVNALAIKHSSQKNNTFVMVGHIERFNPAIIKLKKMVDEGRFGNIINLLVIRVGLQPPRTMQSDVTLDLAIHDIDIFNYLLNDIPLKKNIVKNKIFNANIADVAGLLFEYKKNITGMIQTNWITPIKMRKLYVTGTDGFAEVDYIRQKLVVYGKVMIKKQRGDYFDIISFSDAPQKEVYISKKEPLIEELRYFLKESKKNPSYHSIEYAIEALKAVTSP